jgi:2-keto-4-pentenoate hydratase/2-oxohepta-3-ene-1,7-dioic acid hydratase in catechol pathway
MNTTYRRFSAVVIAVCVITVGVSVHADHHGTESTTYLRFQAGDTIAYGILEGDRVRELDGDLYGKWEKTDTFHDLDEVTILVPSQPSKVIALAKNYRSHLGEDLPSEVPQGFFKVPSSLQRHEGPIELPTDNVHYEAELVIVIGKRAKNISEEEAYDHILGATIGNDISARDWQGNDTQWWRAKGADTFGPCGPYIVSGLDYDNLDLKLRVNGETLQDTNTSLLIHGIAKTVSFLSHHTTLEPGDLIYTGTPGTTTALAPGDIVEVELEGVGILKNPVVKKGK